MNRNKRKVDFGVMMSIFGFIFILGMSSLMGGCDWFDIGGSSGTDSDGWSYPIANNSSFKWRVVSSLLEFQGEAGKTIKYVRNTGSELTYATPFYVEEEDFIFGTYNGEEYSFAVYFSAGATDIVASIVANGETIRLAPSPKINEIDTTSISLSGPVGETIKYKLDSEDEKTGTTVSVTAPATGYKSHVLVVGAGDASKTFMFKLYASSATITKVPSLLVNGGTDDWWKVGSATRTYRLKGEGATTVVAYTTGGGDPTDASASSRVTGTGEINFSLSATTTIKVAAQTPGKSWSPITTYEVQNSGSQIPEFWAYSGGTWVRVAGDTTLPYGTQLQVRGVSGARGQIKLVGAGGSIPTATEMDSIPEVTLPYDMTATSSAVIAARARLSGESWSSIVSLRLTVSGGTPVATTWPFAVSFSPIGGRPLYIKRLATMSTTSTVAETICDGVIQTSVNLKAGWYKVGAGSSAVGWLQDGIFRLTLGSITSPASLSGFSLDNENHYQWFVTIKNDGTIVSGLVAL